MNIILAKNIGFCFGVKKAVETANSIFGNNVCILGEIIHNDQVLNKIKEKGTIILNSVHDVTQDTCIIRSHGIGKSEYKILENKKINIIDCTCPFVKKIHSIVNDYYSKGFHIIIIGKKTHPEVIGINGWCNDSATIIEDESFEEELNKYEKICVVCQTTFSNDKYEKILKKINNYCIKIVEIFKTICYTTLERQKEVDFLSKKCDAMIILGSLSSSNTNKLYEISKNNCKNTFMIETFNESLKNKFKNFKNVGIVTGASTPIEQVMEVFLTMDENANKDLMQEELDRIDNKKALKRGQLIDVVIAAVNDDGLSVYFDGKTEFTLSKEQLACEEYNKDNYKEGDELKVIVMNTKPLSVSEKQILVLKQQEELANELKEGKIINVLITGKNKGGLLGKYESFDVFIPAGEIKIGFVKDLDKYNGKTLRVKPLKVEDKKKKEIVGSQKVILEAEKQEREELKAKKEEEFFANIAENDVVTGTVVRFAQFGAFVDVNGFDCLAHVSDLSWTQIKDPSEVLKIGQKYDFVVKKCDKENKKVSLGYKQLLPKPWDLVADKYNIGDTITGKVVRIVNFGAFVEVEKGIDGLVHVSQISNEFLENPNNALKVGEEVTAKILAIDPEKEKMTLSIKALIPVEEKVVEKKEKEEKPKREKKAKKASDEEVREWSEGDTSISIAELLNK